MLLLHLSPLFLTLSLSLSIDNPLIRHQSPLVVVSVFPDAFSTTLKTDLYPTCRLHSADNSSPRPKETQISSSSFVIGSVIDCGVFFTLRLVAFN